MIGTTLPESPQIAMRKLDFYFDFMSPFAYLAHSQLPRIARKYGCELVYKPIDLPAAKAAAGNTGPPNVRIPVKLRYLKVDLDRWATRYGVPLQFPKSLNSESLNIGTFYAEDRGQAEDYVRTAWHPVWGLGGDMGDAELIRGVARDMRWDPDDFMRFVQSAEAKARYAQGNLDAHQRGVFGAPTMMLGDEMWWGNDRLAFLEERLAAGT